MSDRDQKAQAEAPQNRVERTSLRLLVSPDSYGMTLIVIAVTYVLSAAVRPAWGGLVVAIQMLAVWLIFRVSRASRTTRSGIRLFLVAVALFLITQLVLSVFLGNQELVKGVPLLSAMLYFLAPIAVLRDVASRRTVDIESLFGALAAYLLIGMFFAFAYRSISVIQPAPFYGRGGEGTMAQHLFFSFITLTTTGYGNLVPAQNPGQTFAVCEALMGQIFLLTAFAKIVSAWKPARFGQSQLAEGESGTAESS